MFAANGDAFHPLLNDRGVVYGMLVAGVVLEALQMYRLIPLLKARENGRIINVSSGAGSIENLTGETPAYSLSKNGLNMLTISLAADLADDGIAVNAADPGWVRTEMGGENAPESAEEGADTIIWLALDVPQKLTGGFFRNRTSVSW